MTEETLLTRRTALGRIGAIALAILAVPAGPGIGKARADDDSSSDHGSSDSASSNDDSKDDSHDDNHEDSNDDHDDSGDDHDDSGDDSSLDGTTSWSRRNKRRKHSS